MTNRDWPYDQLPHRSSNYLMATFPEIFIKTGCWVFLILWNNNCKRQFVAGYDNNIFPPLNGAEIADCISSRRGGWLKNKKSGNLVMKKILIVDDDDLFLKGFDKVLQTVSPDVKTVETGNAALREIEASQYHLCFLDLFLPDLNGVDVLNRIRETSPDTKVIAMTAGIVTSEMQETIEKKAYMFITKPLDLLQIRMLTRRILEEPA